MATDFLLVYRTDADPRAVDLSLDPSRRDYGFSSRQELLSCFRMVSAKKHEVMIQEIISGDADRMFGFNAYYDQTGASHGMFMYQRIREWPLGFGNGSVIQQVHVPLLEQLTTSLIRMIGYYGIVDAEFKYDSRDGQYKFIEINPRVWVQNSFPSRFGCNLPYLAYLDAVQNRFQRSRSLLRFILLNGCIF